MGWHITLLWARWLGYLFLKLLCPSCYRALVISPPWSGNGTLDTTDHMGQTKEVRSGVSQGINTCFTHCLASCSMSETSGNTVRKVLTQVRGLGPLTDDSQEEYSSITDDAEHFSASTSRSLMSSKPVQTMWCNWEYEAFAQNFAPL